jgi:hypothetical protein
MFESSINKYFSSSTISKIEKPTKDKERFDSEEAKKPTRREKKEKFIKSNNESINFSSANLLNSNNNNNSLSPIEQEAYSVIQELNNQLLRCNEELDRRNEELTMKNEELENVKNYKIHIEHLSRQVTILQDKIRIYETESGLKSNKLKSVRID